MFFGFHDEKESYQVISENQLWKVVQNKETTFIGFFKEVSSTKFSKKRKSKILN